MLTIWIFFASLGVCAYAYLGYPALLVLLARLRPRPVRRAPVRPTLTVVIPAFNEEAVIERKLRDTLDNGYPRELLEIVVASDGSTDRTNEIVRSCESTGVRLLALPRSGKVTALNAAARAARGDILVFTDADVVLDAGALEHLVSNFAGSEVGGVTGRKASLTQPGAAAIGRGEGLYTRFDEWQKALESRIGSTVAAHGALHAVRRELFVPISDPSGADDMAISMRVVLQGHRLVYEPRAVARVDLPWDARMEFRRKVRIANQVMRALRDLGPALWSSGFYSVQLISHKLLRYCVPAFLILMLVTNTALVLAETSSASGLWWLPWMLQLAFYGMALSTLFLGHRVRGVLRRVLAVPYYFCVVNTAALAAWFSMLRGRHSGTWSPGGGFHEGQAGAGRYAVAAGRGPEAAS